MSTTFSCAYFLWTSVKKDGGVYEPVTLASLQRSIQRYLKDNNSNTNILKDQEFAKSREVISARKRDFVVNNAKGNRPQASRELTKDICYLPGGRSVWENIFKRVFYSRNKRFKDDIDVEVREN